MGRNNGGEEFVNIIKSLYRNDDEKETGVEEWRAEYIKSKNDSFKNNEEIFEKKPVKETENKGKNQIRGTQSPKKMGKLKGRIIAWVLAGIMGGAGVPIGTSACGKINIGNKPIDTKQAVYVLGETPQSLGITNEQYNEIQNINNLLENGNLSDDQIIQMAPRIKDLCIDIITGKLANALGVSDNSIHLEHRYAEEGRTVQTVTVDSNHIITSYRSKDFLIFNNNISDEIATSIKNIDRMNKIMGRIQNGDYKKGSLLNEYIDIINSIDEFAASKVEIDGKENIYVNMIRKKDIVDILEAKGYTPKTKQEIEENLKPKTSNNGYGENLNPINPNIEQIQNRIREEYYNGENTNGKDTNGKDTNGENTNGENTNGENYYDDYER